MTAVAPVTLAAPLTAVAVMLAVPVATAVTKPVLALTVATAKLSDAQVTVAPLKAAPVWSLGAAAICKPALPITAVAGDGVTATLVS